MSDRSTCWREMPIASAAIRFGVALIPFLSAVGVGLLLVRFTPPAGDSGQQMTWWILAFAIATLVLLLTGQAARTAMPLAVLLRLSLQFPHPAPSRWRLARLAMREGGAEKAPLQSVGAARATERLLLLVAEGEGHDRATRGHAERVRLLTDLIARELGLATQDRDRLRWAAMLHDVGKLAVPQHVLNKPGHLDPYEWELVRSHPTAGARLISPVRSWLGPWAVAVDEHHERFDGAGYPSGLAGEKISLGGRVLAVADSFEAMTAMRPYRRQMRTRAARGEIAAAAGTQFDPAVVEAFLRIPSRKLAMITGPLSLLALTSPARGPRGETHVESQRARGA